MNTRVANQSTALLLIIIIGQISAFAQRRGESPRPPANNEGRQEAQERSPAPGASTLRATESGIASPITARSATSAPAVSANAVAYYGTWLDDASTVAPGEMWVGISTGYWRGRGHQQIDAPVASAAVGLTSRIHAGGSLSFYHFRGADGLMENGFGSTSVYGKFVVVDPSRHAVGFAVTPLCEISPGGGDEQIGWALPVSLESRYRELRVYGSAGYFSRGSIFATVGADVPISARVSLNGSFGQARASASANQRSLSIGSFISMTPTAGVFVGLGHTSMPAAIGIGGLSFSGGMSFAVLRPAAP